MRRRNEVQQLPRDLAVPVPASAAQVILEQGIIPLLRSKRSISVSIPGY